MFGTDLNTAYFQNNDGYTNSSENMINTHQQRNIENIPDSIPPPNNKIPDIPQQYDPTIYTVKNDNDDKIIELQKELLKQKQINIQYDVDTIYDRFASKKKDVFKLLNISFTVLLAISLHFVLSDLIKNYIMNNEFSSNKEMIIKISYPCFIFLFLWCLKVFNK
jgi:hypothetical protein